MTEQELAKFAILGVLDEKPELKKKVLEKLDEYKNFMDNEDISNDDKAAVIFSAVLFGIDSEKYLDKLGEVK